MSATKTQKELYTESLGRRKSSIARVRLYEGKNGFIVNDKEVEVYFPVEELVTMARESLDTAKLPGKYFVSVKVSGGGIASQADAVRLGIARAVVKIDPEKRSELKKLGFLKRDPRAKERRKFGLKKARKAPQWSKR